MFTGVPMEKEFFRGGEKSFNEIVFEPFGFEHPMIIVPIPGGEKLP